MCPSVNVYPQRLFQQIHRFKTARHSAGSYYVHKHMWLILFTVVYYCVYLFMNETIGKTWLQLSVLYHSSYLNPVTNLYILLEKGFMIVISHLKLSVLFLIAFFTVSHSWEALPHAVLPAAISLLKHRSGVDQSPAITLEVIKCAEEEGVVYVYKIVYLNGSHLCLHFRTIPVEGDFNICQHWAYQLS